MKSLRVLLSKSAEGVEKAPPPKAAAKITESAKDYRAVSIAPGIKSCLAATEIAGKRYLFREGLRVPLAGCTMPANCVCKFKKVSDRRDEERRNPGPNEPSRWFVGSENRKLPGRAGRRFAKKDRDAAQTSAPQAVRKPTRIP